MSDSTGARLDAALREQSDATYYANRRFDSGVDDAKLYAKHSGAAAGHAFRAAELAYDLGQQHARARMSNAMRRHRAGVYGSADDEITDVKVDAALDHMIKCVDG